MNNYEEKRQARISRYKELAEKNKILANAHYDKSHKMAEVIPMGQPIIARHHSEKKDRAYRAKIERTFKKGMELDGKAKYYEHKAQAALNNTSISSDNPKAIELLKEKLKKLEEAQETMKAINKIVRNKKINDEEKIKQIINFGFSEESARKILAPDFCGRVGFASYELQNNNANIARIKKRLIELEKRITEETTEEIINTNIKIIDNVEANRLQIFFPDIPSEEVRKELKKYGFKWSRFNGCWQRFRNFYTKNISKNF